MKISVVIPACNEAENIGPVVREALVQDGVVEVVVVDDGSHDGTGDLAREAGARVLRHPYNIGNGASIKTGARAARGDVIVFLDGDGQHPPEDIPRLVAYLDEFDLIVGARDPSTHANVQRRLGNQVYNAFASYVAQFPIQDLTSGFRAIRSDLLRHYLYLLPNGFSYPTTLTLAVLRTGRSLRYVPIRARERKGQSKIKLIKDGAQFFLIIVRIGTLFSPLRVFLPVSLCSFMLGVVHYALRWHEMGHPVFSNMTALLWSTAVVIFMLGLVSEQVAQLRLDRTEEGETPAV